MTDHSYLYNAAFLDELYETYLANPTQVSEEWRDYFVQLQKEQPLSRPEISHAPIRAAFAQLKTPLYDNYLRKGADNATLDVFAKKQAAVLRLINAHRFRGHQEANLDPLQLQERAYVDELYPEHYGLTEADMSTVFHTGSLKTTYCGTIGAEYMHITETKQKRWIQQRLEGPLATQFFERYQTRYSGTFDSGARTRRVSTDQICWTKTLFS